MYERKIFTIKDSRSKQESFLDEAKVFYTDLINQMVIDDKDRLSIFDKNAPYLATKKVGKNNPKAEAIKANNEIRMEWNRAVDRAIVSGVSETEILELKKTEIMDRVKESVAQNGNKPELLGEIVRAAVALLEKLIAKVMQKVMNLVEKAIDKGIDAVEETPREKGRLSQPKPSVFASKYPRLKEIDSRLKDQNRAIFEREKKRDKLKKELSKRQFRPLSGNINLILFRHSIRN